MFPFNLNKGFGTVTIKLNKNYVNLHKSIH